MSKLLSQGGFGCVYYPGITCAAESQTNKDIVTKIQQYDFNAKNEIYIGKKIQKIPNFQLFFLPTLKHCKIHLASIDPKLLSNCEAISDTGDDNLVLLDIAYTPNKAFFSLLTDFGKSKKNIILDMTETYSYLLNSIQSLLRNNIVHFDLKSENILYSINSNNPLLIDFGLSIPVDKVKTEHHYKDFFYVYAPDYYIWPIEVHTINFLLHKTKSPLHTNDVDDICSAFVKHNKGLQVFSNDFKKKYLDGCKEALNPYIGQPTNNVINSLFSAYKTWDNYGLSILYLRLLKLMFGNGFMKNKLLIYFSQLLLQNINPLPEKRNSVENSLKTYKDIFFLEENATDYYSLIENFDYK